MTDQEKQLQSQIPEEYKPISMWGYFGYELLFSIPCIGFILLILLMVYALGLDFHRFFFKWYLGLQTIYNSYLKTCFKQRFAD